MAGDSAAIAVAIVKHTLGLLAEQSESVDEQENAQTAHHLTAQGHQAQSREHIAAVLFEARGHQAPHPDVNEAGDQPG